MKFKSDIEIQAGVEAGGSTGSNGQVLSSTGSGVAWINQGDITIGEAETAKSLQVTVKNVSGGELTKGTVVHTAPTASPPSGNVIEVIAADYDDTTKMPAIGILKETIANEAEGEAVMTGALSGIATDAFSIGDELYVGADGALTNVKPQTAGQLIQKIAVCVKSHASNGLIKIFGAGRSNDVPLPLYIDNANQRLGIGTASPSEKLEVAGKGLFTGTEVKVQNASDPSIQVSDTDANYKGAMRWLSSDNVLEFYTRYAGTYYTSNLVLDRGNVGIGEINPGAKLDVDGDVLIKSGEYISWGTVGATSIEGSTVSNKLQFRTNSSDRMIINSSGNVGIGTTSPSAKLHVSGNSVINGTYRGGALQVNDYNYNTDGVRVYGYSNNEMLSLISRYDQADGGMFFKRGNNGSESTIGEINWVSNQFRVNATVGSMVIQTGNSTAITIDSSQNVGIGATSPGAKLHVLGSGENGGILFNNSGAQEHRFYSSANSQFNAIGSSTPIWYWAQYTGVGVEPNYKMTLNNTGLGIGTTDPGAKLDVNGGLNSAHAIFSGQDGRGLKISTENTLNNDDGVVYDAQTSTGKHLFKVSGSEKMRITSGGELIINGTTSTYGVSQGYPLHVKGTASQGYVSICRGTQNSGSEGLIVGTDSSNAYLLSRDNIPLILGSNNLSHVFIKPSGNVGIGTTSPGEKLTVTGNIQLTDKANSVLFGSAGGDGTWGAPKITRIGSSLIMSDYSGIQLGGYNGSSYGARMVVKGTGEVGIGTDSPSANLDVRSTNSNYVAAFYHSTATGYAPGSILLEAGQGSSRGQGIYHYNNVADENWFTGVPYNVNSKKWIVANKYSTVQAVDTAQLTYALMTIDSDTGNVGIGTSSPSQKLHIVGDSVESKIQLSVTGNTGNTQIHFGDDDDVNSGRVAYNHSEDSMSLYTNNSEKFRINSNGNVGIGVVPADRNVLDIRSDDTNGVFVTHRNNDGFFLNRTYADYNNDGNTVEYQERIGVDGNRSSIGNFSNHTLGIRTNNQDRITVLAGGNVGINNTNPETKLDVRPDNNNGKVLRVGNYVVSTYFYNTQADATIDLTCGSYYQAEVIITANQTNGGDYNNIYIRGIWSNNHETHHWDEIESIGFLGGSSIGITVGEDTVSNSGKLSINFNYTSQSFSALNIKVTDFYNSHSYSIS